MIAPLVVCFVFEEKSDGVLGLKLLERSRYVRTIKYRQPLGDLYGERNNNPDKHAPCAYHQAEHRQRENDYGNIRTDLKRKFAVINRSQRGCNQIIDDTFGLSFVVYRKNICSFFCLKTK